MARIRFNRNFNVNRVVKRLVRSVLGLYVGGMVMTVFGQAMTCSYSPFYTGITLIGWTVTNSVNASTAVNYQDAGGALKNCTGLGATQYNNVITNYTGSGVLAVVGIIAIAQIVTEFISW